MWSFILLHFFFFYGGGGGEMGRRKVSISVQTNMVLFLWCGKHWIFWHFPPSPHTREWERSTKCVYSSSSGSASFFYKYIFWLLHFCSLNFWSRKVLEVPFYRQNVFEEQIQYVYNNRREFTSSIGVKYLLTKIWLFIPNNLNFELWCLKDVFILGFVSTILTFHMHIPTTRTYGWQDAFGSISTTGQFVIMTTPPPPPKKKTTKND